MVRRSNKPFFKYTGIIFFSIIILVFLLNLILPDRSFSDKENRVLSSFPAPNARQMLEGREEAKYETYVNDQFLFRDAWITMKAGIDRLLGKVESNGVWLCSDGYLMEAFHAPSDERLDEMISAVGNFASRHSDLRQTMLIVPNAVNIMSFRLPAGAQTDDQNVYMDRLKSAVKENGITYIDIRDMLSSHSNERLYYHTDHHWTTLAAYYTYLASADQLDLDTSILTYDQLPVSKSFQGTLSAKSGFRSGEKEEMYVFLPRNDTAPDYVVNYVTDRVKSASYYKTERLQTRDKYAMFFDGNHAEVKISTPSAEDRTLLIFKDSYANCFVPFLAPHYRNIIMIDPRYYYGRIDDVIAAENVSEILYLYNANTFFSDTSLPLTLADDGISDAGAETAAEAVVSTGTENSSSADTTASPAGDTAGTDGTTSPGSESEVSDTEDSDSAENYDSEDYGSDTWYGDDESYYDESYDENYDYDYGYDDYSYDDYGYDDYSYDEYDYSNDY